MMYSNEDLERFYFQYQTESLPSGESLQSFCKRNNVPYNIFSKCYKDTRKRIVEVSVEGRHSGESYPDFPVPDVTEADYAVLNIGLEYAKCYVNHNIFNAFSLWHCKSAFNWGYALN